MERWYWRDHSPEIVRRYGMFSARHDSYLPVTPPVDARRFGHFNWRFTEGFWRTLPAPGAAGALSFTVPPVFPRVAVCFTPWQATDDICGSETQGCARPILRWVLMHRYPSGVDVEQADGWFRDTHLPELRDRTRLWRLFSTRTLENIGPLPGTWPKHPQPPADSVLLGWNRVTELWFDDFSAWKDSFPEQAAFTPPPWSEINDFPYLRPDKNFVSTFLLERPTDEFLRDARGYV